MPIIRMMVVAEVVVILLVQVTASESIAEREEKWAETLKDFLRNPKSDCISGPVDPLLIPEELIIKDPGAFPAKDIEVVLNSLVLKGLSQRKVERFTVELPMKKTLSFSIFFPELRIDGEFKLSADTLVKRWTKQGDFEITAKDAKVDLFSNLDVQETDGGPRIRLEDVQVNTALPDLVIKIHDLRFPLKQVVDIVLEKKVEQLRSSVKQLVHENRNEVLKSVNTMLDRMEF